MKFLSLSIILIEAKLIDTVPQGMMLYVTNNTDCSTTENPCPWGFAESISESMLKNVYVTLKYGSTPATIITKINCTMQRYSNLKPLTLYLLIDSSATNSEVNIKTHLG